MELEQRLKMLEVQVGMLIQMITDMKVATKTADKALDLAIETSAAVRSMRVQAQEAFDPFSMPPPVLEPGKEVKMNPEPIDELMMMEVPSDGVS